MNVYYSSIREKTRIYKEVNPSAEIDSLILAAGFKEKVNPDKVLNYIPRWPLVVHHFCAVFCLGASAAYHFLWIKSEPVAKFLAQLDYGGICLLIMGSTYPLTFYVFACEKVFWVRNLFLIISTISNVGCFMLFMFPKFNSSEFRSVRATLFITLGISAVAPFTYLS